MTHLNYIKKMDGTGHSGEAKKIIIFKINLISFCECVRPRGGGVKRLNLLKFKIF